MGKIVQMDTDRYSDSFIEVQGLKIAYEISGLMSDDAPAAVILQGWGTSYRHYDLIERILKDRYKVIRFDLPGFGESEEPEESWDVEGYAVFVLSLLDKLGIGRAMLIGHSYGGRIIIRLASKDSIPLKITRIILIDSAGILPVRTPSQKRKQLIFKILKKIYANKVIYFLFDEIIDDWKNRQGSEDYRRATPLMRKTLVKAVNEDLTDLLPKIKQETMLIWGEADSATPMRDAHIMEEKIPDSALAVIPGAGHFSFAENPKLFEQIINAYLDGTEA